MTSSRPAIRALLIDLSGTLHVGSIPTPSAVAALKHVREAGITVRFCSNTSKECTADLRARLSKIGFDVQKGELWTSLGALKDIVKVRNFQRPYFLLSKSAMEEFPEFMNASENDTELHHSHYDSVIIGLAPEHFNYKSLTKAFRILTPNSTSSTDKPRTQVAPPLITTHRAKYIRTSDGELSLGPGPFVTALEDAVGGDMRAEAIGKPNRAFFERVLASLNTGTQDGLSEGESGKWEGVAVIGDDIEADLGGGAVELGLWRVLVKTGKYRPGDESRSGLHPPDEVQDSFASFVDELLKA